MWEVLLAQYIEIYEDLSNNLVYIGGSFCATSSYTLAGNMLGEKHQGKGIALVETSYGVGTMFGPTVGGLLYDFGGFLLPFSATGVLMITVAIFSALFLEDLRKRVDHGLSGKFQNTN